MCGVAGILSFEGKPPEHQQEKNLRRMSDALAHRGPDGSGYRVFGPCGLAHRRLAIIDLSPAAAQPMCTTDEKLAIVYNGEVYNHVEIRADLEARGFEFKTHSDTEVVLAAYRAFGQAAFARFNGMWGLAIWDEERRELVLSRDRFGVKPLYLHRTSERLIFASEIKALLAVAPHTAEIDPRGVARFITRADLTFGRTTLFKDIEALDPGVALTVGVDGRTEKNRYWTFRPPARPTITDPTEGSEAVKALLTDAVRLRFRSDVPVGTCLSGGLDSSSIVAIAHKVLGLSPKAFSAIYETKGFDEGRFVRSMQREFALVPHEVMPDGRDLADVLERVTAFQETPGAGPGIYSQWHVMRLASQHVKVLLDGQGADELFGGYRHHPRTALRGLIRRLERGELSTLPAILRLSSSIKRETGEQVLRKILGYPRSITKRVQMRSHRLLTPESERLLELERASWGRPAVTGDDLTDKLWDELIRTSLPSLLHYEDRNSMAFSIEARTPFLDYRLVELAFHLAPDLKVDGVWSKAILRSAMRGVVPEVVLQRRDKLGYPTPFGHWIRTHHADWLRDVLFSKRFLDRGFVNPAAIHQCVEEHLHGTDHSGVLYRLLSLELFCRRFADATSH